MNKYLLFCKELDNVRSYDFVGFILLDDDTKGSDEVQLKNQTSICRI